MAASSHEMDQRWSDYLLGGISTASKVLDEGKIGGVHVGFRYGVDVLNKLFDVLRQQLRADVSQNLEDHTLVDFKHGLTGHHHE